MPRQSHPLDLTALVTSDKRTNYAVPQYSVLHPYYLSCFTSETKEGKGKDSELNQRRQSRI